MNVSKKYIGLISFVAAICHVDAVFAMDFGHVTGEQIVQIASNAMANVSPAAMLGAIRADIIQTGRCPRSWQDSCRDESARLVDLANQLKVSRQIDERARLQCQMNQLIVVICTSLDTVEEAYAGYPLTPGELERIKQVKRDFYVRVGREVDEEAAKLGLPSLNPGFFPNAKNFLFKGNRKYFTIPVLIAGTAAGIYYFYNYFTSKPKQDALAGMNI